jgi:hypothetical protein
MLEPICQLAALFARGEKADISTRGTKSVNIKNTGVLPSVFYVSDMCSDRIIGSE